MKNKKVLVTGAGGFIGSHLVQRLIGQGAEVRAMTHYRSSPDLHNLAFLSKEELEKIEVRKGNIEDPFFVRGCAEGIDYIFHLAALIAIPYSYVAPAAYVATNISGTLNVLEAAKAEGVERMIHTSTSECYGSAQFTPMDESHPLVGQSPYSASKISADKLVESYHRSFSTPVVTIRPFNTYGPRQSGRAIIPTIISQLIANAPEIRIGSTTPVRDFTFVTDTADGFIRGALAEGVEGEVVNLGFGKGISIGELAKVLLEAVGRDIPIVSEQERLRPVKSEVVELVSNNSKARDVLSWTPQVEIRDGLSQTIDFIRENQNYFLSETYEI